jgi:hypothetical protein
VSLNRLSTSRLTEAITGLRYAHGPPRFEVACAERLAGAICKRMPPKMLPPLMVAGLRRWRVAEKSFYPVMCSPSSIARSATV